MSGKPPSSLDGEGEKKDETTGMQEVVDVLEEGRPGKALLVNASGHVDELDRQYGLMSICATALTIDNAWVALGGSITIAVANGGPPGVIYEFLAACFYYAFIAASIAELASSVPSSGGVYHWASVTPGPKLGRSIGFFTGWLNYYGWMFGLSAISYVPANILLQTYLLFHPEFIILPWHLYLTYVLISIFCCSVVVFGNKFQPLLQNLGLLIVVVGGVVTVIVVAVMPKQHASNAFVWTEWTNGTGWSNGVAFLTGMLNGAFTIGTPDSVTHMAEELPHPRRDLPKAIAAQIILGTITGFIYAVAIMYGISDLDAVLTSNGSFPLAEVYAQATGNTGGTFGLLLIVFVSIMICTIGVYVTVGRIWWTLARDNVTPFASFFSKVSIRLSCPVIATVFCCILILGLGAISLGSKTAFTDLAAAFAVLTTTSYLCAILPHLLSRRSNIPRGPFWMGGVLGYVINSIAVILTVFTNVMYCFPYTNPTTAETMNYNSVVLFGCVVLTIGWWFVHGMRNYQGPKLPHMDELGKEIVEDEK